MKQKSLRKESLYKIFDLGGMLGIRTQSKSWSKCSFVKLLGKIFSRRKGLIKSVYFHILLPPINFRDSRRNDGFIRNTPLLFASFLLISIYCSDNGRVRGRRDFYFTEIQRQTRSNSDYTDIYVKYSQSLDKIFHTLQCKFQFLRDSKNEYKIYLSNSLVFRGKSLLGHKLIPRSEFVKYLCDSGSYVREGYIGEESIMDPASIQTTTSNDSSCLETMKFYGGYLGNGGSLDFLTSQQERVGIINYVKYIYQIFLKLFSIRGLGGSIGKNFDRIPMRDIRNRYYSDNYVEKDGIITNSSPNSHKYYSRLLCNYLLPINPVYNIIQPNFITSHRIYGFRKGSKYLLPEIIHLSPLIHPSSKNSNIFVNQIKLKRDLTRGDNQLNLSMDRSIKIRDFNSLFLSLPLERIIDTKSNYNCENELINDYFLTSIYIKSLNFYDYIGSSYPKYLSQLSKNLSVKKLFFGSICNHGQGKITHKYSMGREAVVMKSSIWHIETYKNTISQIYKWIDKICNWIIFNSSKRFVPSNLSREFKSLESFKTFIRNDYFEGIDRVPNSSGVSTIDSDLRSVYNQSFHRSRKYLNGEFLMNSFAVRQISNDWVIKSLIVETKNHKVNPKSLDCTTNHELVTIPDFRLNCDKRFLFHPGDMCIRDCDIIYSKALRDLSKSNEFASAIARKKYFSFEKDNSMLAKSQLCTILSSGMLYEDLYGVKSKSFCIICYQLLIKKYFCTKIYLKNFVRIMPVSGSDDEIVEKSHCDVLSYVSLVRGGNRKISQLVKRIPSYFVYEDSESEIGDGVPEGGSASSIFNRSPNSYLFARPISSGKYMSWFFTPEWWEYHTHPFLGIFREVSSTIKNYFEFFWCYHIRIIEKILLNSLKKGKDLYDSDFVWASDSFFDEEEVVSELNRLDSRFISSWNWLWTVIILVSFMLLSQQNPISILIGSDSLCLWEHFETIEYLTDTSRAFYSNGSMSLNEARSNKMENSIIYFLEILKHFVRNIRFYLLTKRWLDEWLINNKSLDLSRRGKNLLVQSLITHTRMKRYGFELYPKRELLSNRSGYRVTNQQGFSYLRYLSEILRKKLIYYPLGLTNKWIYLVSLEKMIFSQTLCRERKIDARIPQIPIPLQSGLYSANGILLVGPIETGRSYLIKNFAADSCVPLLGIDMDRFLYNKPDIITDSWMNILVESLRRLNLILDFTRGMSPCMIWIRNIHRLDVNNPTWSIESEPTFLLGILLRYFQTNSIKTRAEKNLIVIGSTHLPGKVDPALISAERLDRIINTRVCNKSRRKNHFFILLDKNNLRFINNLLYHNVDSRTTGYSIRDLSVLTNEVSLISITKNKLFVCADTIELASRRQIFRFTHTNNQSHLRHNFGVLFYKIGKAIIQNILITKSFTNLLSISNYLWKKNFYYLSQWYLELSIDNSIMKEFTILIHILNCLAGIAARDSWFLPEKNSDTLIPLDKSLENDLSLASSILESFPMECSWLENRGTQFVNHERRETKILSTKSYSSIIQNGLFSISGSSTIRLRNNSKYKSLVFQRKLLLGGRNFEFQNTAWSPRSWRLSFYRSHLFDWMKRPNDSEFPHEFNFLRGREYTILDNLGVNNHPNQLMEGRKDQLIYERILPRVRRRNVQELEFRLEQILLEEQSEISGFFQSSLQYRMEYLGVGNKPRFFIGKRILWDPTGSSIRIRNFIFSRRDFFVDEEMSRRLYVTYGVRRERERSLFNHRIKRFFLRRGYNKELIDNLSVRWWNQLSIGEGRNIGKWKRIEEIGARSRRPQVFTPVYLYQRWLIENLPEKFPRLELVTQRQRWLGITNPLSTSSFTHTTLSESYQYLLGFFSSNKMLLDRATEMLFMKKRLLGNEIGYLIHNRNIKNS
uniref:Hypothetical chloroplast RF2 n=1 Tax=Aneura pinguis TaxID=39026 RepID=A0A221SD01_ANEPI|nr:hypothetical chloroplast RF2 [Aneura pinguis]WGO58920.1 hypothetical chloroplast RF2 [Aneura pinguis]WGO59006.1 hypothetical chloroplast RF2 [Aneura pinguis]WGO60640.1 hypothetical chloroplast RF2 [Aneura pinguis]